MKLRRVAGQVRARSREIRPGVFQVTGSTYRDPASPAGT